MRVCAHVVQVYLLEIGDFARSGNTKPCLQIGRLACLHLAGGKGQLGCYFYELKLRWSKGYYSSNKRRRTFQGYSNKKIATFSSELRHEDAPASLAQSYEPWTTLVPTYIVDET